MLTDDWDVGNSSFFVVVVSQDLEQQWNKWRRRRSIWWSWKPIWNVSIESNTRILAKFTHQNIFKWYTIHELRIHKISLGKEKGIFLKNFYFILHTTVIRHWIYFSCRLFFFCRNLDHNRLEKFPVFKRKSTLQKL